MKLLFFCALDIKVNKISFTNAKNYFFLMQLASKKVHFREIRNCSAVWTTIPIAFAGFKIIQEYKFASKIISTTLAIVDMISY